MDYIYVGSTPYEEDCAQVGTSGYLQEARKECTAYINQLTRVYGEPPGDTHYRIKAESHDFGTYFEVVIYYNDSVTEEVDYAYQVEAGCAEWDEQAKKELGI